MFWPSTIPRSSNSVRWWPRFRQTIRSLQLSFKFWILRKTWPTVFSSLSIKEIGDAWFPTSEDFWKINREELQPLGRDRCQRLREIFSDPRWRTYSEALRLRRVKLIDRLSGETDPLQIYRMQGALRELQIIDRMPEEIESLDKVLEAGEKLRTMVNDKP